MTADDPRRDPTEPPAPTDPPPDDWKATLIGQRKLAIEEHVNEFAPLPEPPTGVKRLEPGAVLQYMLELEQSRRAAQAILEAEHEARDRIGFSALSKKLTTLIEELEKTQAEVLRLVGQVKRVIDVQVVQGHKLEKLAVRTDDLETQVRNVEERLGLVERRLAKVENHGHRSENPGDPSATG